MFPALLRDPIGRIGAGILILAALPYLVPVLPAGWMQSYGRYFNDVPLLLVAIAAFQHRRSPVDGKGRQFWNLLTLAAGCWLMVRVINVLVSDEQWRLYNIVLVEDILYAGSLLFVALALERQPHVPAAAAPQAGLSGLQSAGTVVGAFGILVYFVVIPSALNPDAYTTWLPSQLLFILLDLYIVARALALRRVAADPRWRAVYAGLLATAALWAATDAYEALMWARVVPYSPPGTLIDLAWFPAYGLFILTGRAYDATPGPKSSEHAEPAWSDALRVWSGGGPLVYMVVLPAAHFVLYGFDILDDASRGPREWWLLLVLAVWAVMAIAYQRLLRAENARLDDEQRAATERLHLAQRMETVGQLTGGIAHDFNNILNIILAHAELIREALRSERTQARRDVEQLIAAGHRARSMVRKLLGFGRRQLLAPQPVALPKVVREFVSALRRLMPDSVDVELACDDEVPPVHADPGAVEQILLNLVTNARDALPQGGRIRIEVGARDLDAQWCARQGRGTPGRYGRLAVMDNGVGMDARTRKKVFEPFFSTKPLGDGSGLGLAMVYGLVEQHGGLVELTSRAGVGTTVEVLLPPSTASVLDPPVLEVGEREGRETILLVDDEGSLRRAAQRVLEAHGYTVLVARNGQEAMDQFRARGGRIDLVLSDIVMPIMSGPEFHDAVRAEQDDTPFLFMTGYATAEAQVSTRRDSLPVLAKPWTMDELLAAVRNALSRRRTSGPKVSTGAELLGPGVEGS